MNKDKKKVNILIIDDDSLVLNGIEKQLMNENFHLELYNDPKIGISKIEKNKFHLIISDIRMKSMTGIDVLRFVKTKYDGLPVILITGHVNETLRKEANEIGCDCYLIKPIRKQILIGAIKKILNKK